MFAVDFAALQETAPYRTLKTYLRDGGSLDEVRDPALREQLARGIELDRHLAKTGEIEALLAGLAGRFVAPGPGGDPIRNPDVPSGRNLYAFEADKIPTRAAFEAGEAALQQLIEQYRAEHDGQAPRKLAFSLWSSEALRHLGIVESQVLHALGLRPVWDAGGGSPNWRSFPPSNWGGRASMPCCRSPASTATSSTASCGCWPMRSNGWPSWTSRAMPSPRTAGRWPSGCGSRAWPRSRPGGWRACGCSATSRGTTAPACRN